MKVFIAFLVLVAASILQTKDGFRSETPDGDIYIQKNGTCYCISGGGHGMTVYPDRRCDEVIPREQT